MRDSLPPGWLPTPFGVPERDAAELAAELVRIAAESLPGFVDCDEARSAMASAVARPPVATGTVGRVWHVLGPGATGAVADLSVMESTESILESPFNLSIPQRTWRFSGGRAILSLVAPREHVPVRMMLRALRRDGDRTLIADVIDDPAVLGLIREDVIALVGGDPTEASARPELAVNPTASALRAGSDG